MCTASLQLCASWCDAGVCLACCRSADLAAVYFKLSAVQCFAVLLPHVSNCSNLWVCVCISCVCSFHSIDALSLQGLLHLLCQSQGLRVLSTMCMSGPYCARPCASVISLPHRLGLSAMPSSSSCCFLLRRAGCHFYAAMHRQ